MLPTPWYRPAPFYLLRSPLLPFTVFERLAQSGHLDLTTCQDLEEAWQQAQVRNLAVITELFLRPEVRQALLIASPSLYEALNFSDTQKHKPGDRASKALERFMRYLLRMSSRSTPFGLCAGVAMGNFASTSKMLRESRSTIKIRPDMAWLLAVVEKIETHFLESLSIQVSPLVTAIGTQGIGQKRKDDGTIERVWFPVTEVIEETQRLARTPIRYADLKRALLATFPRGNAAAVDHFLRDLYMNGILLTTLPPIDLREPIKAVLEELRPLAEAGEFVARLERLQATMDAIPHSLESIAEVMQQQRTLAPHFQGTTLHVDSRIPMIQNSLCFQIGEEAARTAETLLRLGYYPQGLPSLHLARTLFRERYEEQEVPLLNLFHPQGIFDGLYQRNMEIGDLPADQQKRMAQREYALQTLAMQAVNEQKLCVTLTPEIVEQLSCWSTNATAPPLLDLYVQICAASTEAIDQGEWQGLALLLPPGGRSYRRFLHLFGEAEHEQVASFLQAREQCDPAYLHVSLVFQPPNPRDLNVMGQRNTEEQMFLPLNRTSFNNSSQMIWPDDILVSLRDGRFCLRLRSCSRLLRFIQDHMLAFTHIPPLARFLLEASHDGEAFPGSFQWINAAGFPFLPRLSQGHMIVSPAQWSLSACFPRTSIPSQSAQWFQAIQQWRAEWHVPRSVYLLQGEDRLLLDLENAMMVDLLRGELASANREQRPLLLQEGFTESTAWLRDPEGQTFTSELVIPLIRTSLALPSPHLPGPCAPSVEKIRRFQPGQEWIFLKLYGPEYLQNMILAHALPPFLQRSQHRIDAWFFVRYHDPDAHIRLRFHCSDQEQRTAFFQELFAWSQEIQREGLFTRSCLDMYEREIERYGGAEAIELIEQIFWAQSELACALLPQLEMHFSLCVAAYALDRLWSDWGYPLAERWNSLQHHRQPGKEPDIVRRLRPKLLPFLANPPTSLRTRFDERRELFAQVGRSMHSLSEQGKLCRQEEDILWSLSHLFCNRLLGTKRERESEVYAAWYASLQARKFAPATSPA